MRASTPMPQSLQPLLTKQQAADFYATSTRTIDRWLLEGVLPAEAKIVIGGSTRFRTSVLMAHINGTTSSDEGGEL